MSDTGTGSDCTICVANNGDLANVDKDFDLTDISVLSESTVDLTDFDSLSESDNNNGDIDVLYMLMIIITHLAMCYNM